MVYMEKKNSKIRICADYSMGLSNSLKTLYYPLPCQEKIFENLNGRKFFLKIDFSDAYLQIEVNKSCKKLHTINTHKGLYKIDRITFGVIVTPIIFQQIIDAMLAGLDFSVAYFDDILIKSKNRKNTQNT